MASAFSRFARPAGLVTFRQIFVRLAHVRKLPLLPRVKSNNEMKGTA
jgi:hypothetical protein